MEIVVGIVYLEHIYICIYIYTGRERENYIPGETHQTLYALHNDQVKKILLFFFPIKLPKITSEKILCNFFFTGLFEINFHDVTFFHPIGFISKKKPYAPVAVALQKQIQKKQKKKPQRKRDCMKVTCNLYRVKREP